MSTVNITGTLVNEIGVPIPGREVQIHVTGGYVDGATTRTTDAGGLVVFPVGSLTEHTVIYAMTELPNSIEVLATVDVEYTDEVPDPNPPIVSSTLNINATRTWLKYGAGGVHTDSQTLTRTLYANFGEHSTIPGGTLSGDFGIDGGTWTVVLDQSGVVVTANFGTALSAVPPDQTGPYLYLGSQTVTQTFLFTWNLSAGYYHPVLLMSPPNFAATGTTLISSQGLAVSKT